MQIALQETDRLLLGRVIAERDMDMAVDQAGTGGRPVRIDDEIASVDFVLSDLSDRREFPSFIKIASPLAKGSRQSPVTMVPMLTIAVFIASLRELYRSFQAIPADNFLNRMPANPIIQAAPASEHAGDRQFIRQGPVHER